MPYKVTKSSLGTCSFSEGPRVFSATFIYISFTALIKVKGYLKYPPSKYV